MEQTTQKQISHLHELLKDFDTAMLVTRSRDGHMHGRPMAVAQVQPDADCLFVTSIDSPKMAEIDADPDATLTFQDDSRYISVSGRIIAMRDQALLDEL